MHVDAAPQPLGLSLQELSTLLTSHAPRLVGAADVRLTGVQQDSRRVQAGDLFVARAGASSSGASHALEAEQSGAVALLVEHGTELPNTHLPVLEVKDLRLALALAAEAVYGFPSRAVDVVGITGTNGKTTTSFLLEQGLLGTGQRAGRLGTLGFHYRGQSSESSLTTPEADDISRAIRNIAALGGSHLVMEVSSIALSQQRVSGLRFRAAAFTNLTQDHLDFHGSLAAYAAAKAELFTRLSPELCVINVDDDFGRQLASGLTGQVLSVARRGSADVQVVSAEFGPQGLCARVATPAGDCELISPLVGEHNLENLLVALGVLVGLGSQPAAAALALSQAPQVPGRLERCDTAEDDILVVVDYAHTPDALERVLGAMRKLTTARVACVFGCGGDRDRKKRPLMGLAVGRGADHAFVTSDNPRSESAEAIAQAILPGLREASASYQVVLDRAQAIQQAVLWAEPGDVVLVAGKGHEDYQIVGGERRSFDDRVEARRALELRRGRA